MIQLPATREQWQNAVGEAVLPVLGHSRAQAEKLRGRPRLNANRLSDIARGDASLCLQMLGRANDRARSSRSEVLKDGVTSVLHGVALLGVEQSLECILSLPTIDGASEKERKNGMVHTLGKAHLAAELCSLWTDEHEGARPAAYAHFLGELMGWVLGDTPAQRFSMLMNSQPHATTDSQEAAFGVSLETLNTMALEQWDIPFNPERQQDNHTAILRWRARIARLCAELSNAVNMSWYSKTSTACIKQIAEALGTQADRVWTDVHRTTATAARSFFDPSQMHSARTLLLGPGEPVQPIWYKPPETTPQESPATPKVTRKATSHVSDPREPTPPNTTPKQTNVAKACASIIKRFQLKQLNLQEMLLGVTQTIGQTTELDPVLMSMLTRDRQRLTGRFCSTIDTPLLERFDIELSKPSLFSRLLERESGLLVTASNYAKVWQQLPDGCRGLLPEHSFCLNSLFVKGKPVGVFYAAGFSDDPDHAQKRFQQFKKICTATGRALEASTK